MVIVLLCVHHSGSSGYYYDAGVTMKTKKDYIHDLAKERRELINGYLLAFFGMSLALNSR